MRDQAEWTAEDEQAAREGGFLRRKFISTGQDPAAKHRQPTVFQPTKNAEIVPVREVYRPKARDRRRRRAA